MDDLLHCPAIAGVEVPSGDVRHTERRENPGETVRNFPARIVFAIALAYPSTVELGGENAPASRHGTSVPTATRSAATR